MSTNRREFIAGTGAVIAALSNLAACAKRDGTSDVNSLLAEIAEEILADYPENTTSLGIDKDARAGFKARLTDRSAAGQKAIAERVAQRLARMAEVDVESLDEATRLDLDVVRTAHETAAAGFEFPYGDVVVLHQGLNWANGPYVVAQNKGAFLEVPSFLEEQHTIESREDADAYLARLEAYAAQLEGGTGRLRSAAEQGVIAPDFVLDKTLAQLRMARSGIVETWPIIASFTRKTTALPGDYTRQGAKVAFVQRSAASAFCDQMEQATGNRPLCRPCDITDSAALKAAVEGYHAT